MSNPIEFLSLYITKFGVCEYATTNTSVFLDKMSTDEVKNIQVDTLFIEEKFHKPIFNWLFENDNVYWEGIIEDSFKSYLMSIQPVAMDAIIAIVTLRSSIITEKLDQLRCNYEYALSESNVGLWMWFNLDDGKSWWSDSFYTLLGYKSSELKSGIDSFMSLIHPDQKEDFSATMKTFYEQKETYKNLNKVNLETKVRTKDGSYKHLLFTAKSVKLDNSLRFSGTVVDIDLLKKTQIELYQHEAQLQLSMEAANMGTWTWEIEPNKVIWSDHLFEIFEIEKHQFEGSFQSFLKIISNEERSFVKGIIENAMLLGETHFSFKHTLARVNQSQKTLFSKGKIFYKKEKPYRMTGIVLDISKEDSLKNLLEQTQERYKTVFDAMTEGVIIVDMNGVIIDHNLAAAEIIGYENHLLIGEGLRFGEGVSIREDFSTYLFDEVPCIITIRTGRSCKNVPLGWIKSTKELVWLSINSDPIIDKKGVQIGAVCTYIDITERYTALYNLQVKNRQLEDFAHITSHNLRSPISNLSILLDYFETSTNEEDRKEYFQNLKHVSTTLLSTIQVLAESLKINKSFIIDEGEVTFKEILTDVLKLLAGNIKEADVTFDINFDGCKSIRYSKTYLESIFINLISNAIKYRSHDRKPVISVHTSYSNQNHPVLTVTDNGIGIDLNKNSEKIFGLYKTFHSNKDSRGVGLYMTKRQIETLGGTISVSSKINVGTTFTVQFK